MSCQLCLEGIYIPGNEVYIWGTLTRTPIVNPNLRYMTLQPTGYVQNCICSTHYIMMFPFSKSLFLFICLTFCVFCSEHRAISGWNESQQMPIMLASNTICQQLMLVSSICSEKKYSLFHMAVRWSEFQVIITSGVSSEHTDLHKTKTQTIFYQRRLLFVIFLGDTLTFQLTKSIKN